MKQAGAELCQAQANLDLPGFDRIFFGLVGFVLFRRFCFVFFGLVGKFGLVSLVAFVRKGWLVW